MAIVSAIHPLLKKFIRFKPSLDFWVYTPLELGASRLVLLGLIAEGRLKNVGKNMHEEYTHYSLQWLWPPLIRLTKVPCSMSIELNWSTGSCLLDCKVRSLRVSDLPLAAWISALPMSISFPAEKYLTKEMERIHVHTLIRHSSLSCSFIDGKFQDLIKGALDSLDASRK